MAPIELTPKVYKRVLASFTPFQAKESVDKYIAENRRKYSSSAKTLFMDGETF